MFNLFHVQFQVWNQPHSSLEQLTPTLEMRQFMTLTLNSKRLYKVYSESSTRIIVVKRIRVQGSSNCLTIEEDQGQVEETPGKSKSYSTDTPSTLPHPPNSSIITSNLTISTPSTFPLSWYVTNTNTHPRRAQNGISYMPTTGLFLKSLLAQKD